MRVWLFNFFYVCSIGIINHLKSTYPQRVLLWGKSDNVDKIAKLQKRAKRTISFSRQIAHTEPLFKTFNLLKFNDIYTLKLMKFFYKLSNDSLPAYFASYKTLIQPLTTRYPLRRPI